MAYRQYTSCVRPIFYIDFLHPLGVQSGADYYGRRRPRPEDEERTLH